MSAITGKYSERLYEAQALDTDMKDGTWAAQMGDGRVQSAEDEALAASDDGTHQSGKKSVGHGATKSQTAKNLGDMADKKHKAAVETSGRADGGVGQGDGCQVLPAVDATFVPR